MFFINKMALTDTNTYLKSGNTFLIWLIDYAYKIFTYNFMK